MHECVRVLGVYHSAYCSMYGSVHVQQAYCKYGAHIQYIYSCSLRHSSQVLCLPFLVQGQMNLTCFGPWSPSHGIRDVLNAVVKQLRECDPKQPVVDHIAKQYQSDRKLHDSIAREWMMRFAQ